MKTYPSTFWLCKDCRPKARSSWGEGIFFFFKRCIWNLILQDKFPVESVFVFVSVCLYYISMGRFKGNLNRLTSFYCILLPVWEILEASTKFLSKIQIKCASVTYTMTSSFIFTLKYN